MNPAGIFRFVSAEPSSAGNAPVNPEAAPLNDDAVMIPVALTLVALRTPTVDAPETFTNQHQ